MIKLPFLNRNKRKKNVFDIFYNQKKIDITRVNKLKEQNQASYSDLLFVNEIPKTNQYENIPKIEDDELKKIDYEVKENSKNEELLDKLKTDSCKESLENQKPLNKLNVNVNNVALCNSSNEKNYENMALPIVKENIVNINCNDKKKQKKKHSNSIFKKFKN